MRPALLRAYQATCYEVEGTGVRIGKRSPAMDRLLRSFGLAEAAFITACNPFSRVMPTGWNLRMQTRLRQAVRRRPILAGSGSWRGWHEAHLFVLGDTKPMEQLARRFRQNGIVIVRRGQRVRLLIVSASASASASA